MPSHNSVDVAGVPTTQSDLLGCPLRLPCGAVLPNRLAKAALTEGLADERNRATLRHQALYRRWSLGGAGLCITGNVQVDRRFLERPGNVAVDGNGGEQSLADLAAAGTLGGNHLWMQINHPGRQTPGHVHPFPLAPSAVPVELPGFGQPVEMSRLDISDVIRRFAYVAGIARASGFTGVQIHAAHGYLLSQFLSPLSNLRTDDWGGSLADRARLLLTIVQAVRAEVGTDFPIGVKLNSADFQHGGFTSDDCLQVVVWLQENGIDLLEISGGTYEAPQMVAASRTRGDAPILDAVRASTRAREAYFLEYADRIRSVTTVPLMVTGGFRTASAMHAALSSGNVDVIGLGRPLIVQPDGAARLLAGTALSLPACEVTLKLDAASSDQDEFLPVKGWGIQSWFCTQLLNLGDGQEPDLAMSVADALNRYRVNEMTAMNNLQR